MYYVCIEDNIVTSIVDHEPNVPDSVTLETITNAKYKLIANGTGYYDVDKRDVVKHPAKLIKDEEKSKKALAFLQSTDWKILRHLRETHLEIKQTLTVAEYITLEKERHKQAKLVK
jgi:hypothetical protein